MVALRQGRSPSRRPSAAHAVAEVGNAQIPVLPGQGRRLFEPPGWISSSSRTPAARASRGAGAVHEHVPVASGVLGAGHSPTRAIAEEVRPDIRHRALHVDVPGRLRSLPADGPFEIAGGWSGDHHDGVPIFVLTGRPPDGGAPDGPLVTYVTDVATAPGWRVRVGRMRPALRPVFVAELGVGGTALSGPITPFEPYLGCTRCGAGLPIRSLTLNLIVGLMF